MAKVLCYTSPARGHLYPTVPVLLELARRGHTVSVRTLSAEVPTLAALGLEARPVSAAVEAISHDDWRARSPAGALDRAARAFLARADHEVEDLRRDLAGDPPDLLLVDFNCWGAGAVAEASDLPWALFLPYFLPWRLPGLPPFGPGFAPRPGPLGRARDALAGRLLDGLMDRNLPAMNALRGRAGLAPLRHLTDFGRAAPLLLHYTAEPFEYACPDRPAQVVQVGPCAWEPPSAPPAWLAELTRPIVLVTCSTEFQDDGRLAEATLAALAGHLDELGVVATTAAVDPARFGHVAGARIERFLPHGPLLQRAAVVVCHGGMGITQKALAAGVPVCAVPFGRDQLEVARHVEVARAGVRLAPRQLRPARLRAAIEAARDLRDGAARVADGFRKAGGPARAAAALEALLPATRGATRAAPPPGPSEPAGGTARPGERRAHLEPGG